jgi:hypothetical protein
MKALFLDIDGVLATRKEYRKPFLDIGASVAFNEECVERLNILMKEFDDLVIVISSSWRVEFTVEELREIFTARGFKYSERIVGKTLRALTFFTKERGLQSAPRGVEIDRYVRDSDITKYAILDDDTDMLYSQRDAFVKTSFEDGLQDIHIGKIVKILQD